MEFLRDRIAHFIAEEGHRTTIELHGENPDVAAITLRARGQQIWVSVSEDDETFYVVAAMHELPTWARDAKQNAALLLELQESMKAVKFYPSQDRAGVVAAVEQFASSPEEFMQHFWKLVELVRESGASAVARILDRTESKSAAEKFIDAFMRGSQ